uniref:hypothetical protein n=1 Tax=Microvirga soli TaxID=1854496 RepID=UPI00191D94D0|nr:hypothetical protein [Microvirga soli]
MHEAEVVVPERAALALALLRRRQAAQTRSLADAVDGIVVEMRQDGEVIERKAGGLAQAADDGALLVRGLPRQLVWPAGVVLAVLCPAFAQPADGLDAHAEAPGQHARGLI